MSSDAISETVSIFLSFFCRSKVMETHSAYSSSGWLLSSCSFPLKKRMFYSLTISVPCWSAFETLRYSQDCIAKKMPRVASSAVAFASSDPCCLLIFGDDGEWDSCLMSFGWVGVFERPKFLL